MSWQLTTLNLYLRTAEKTMLALEPDVRRARARLDTQAALFPTPAKARIRERPLGKASATLPALRVEAASGAGVLLWYHGGAYVMGSPRSHAAMVAALALKAGVGAVLPEYRLAPEHRFPAAAEDALDAYRALLAEGTPPDQVALGGDSAGGGLAFATLHAVLAEGLPAPAGVIAFSPWVDLSLSGDSLFSLSARDVLLPIERIPEIRDMYLGDAGARDPAASPVFGRYAGAPPVLIQASDSEILLDDARAMAARLEADGAAVALDIERGVPHVWQLYQGWLPEADDALDRAAAFLRNLLPD
jgi:acetyl esterase/lipase